MHHNRLVLGAVTEGRVNGIAHPGSHRAPHFEVAGGDRSPLFVVGQGDLVHALPHILEIADDGQDGHQFGAGGDAELRLHRESVFLAAHADSNVTQALGAEIHDPAEFHARRVNVQPPHAGQFLKVGIIVIALMLHSGGQGYHSQVVGIHNIVDVTGQAHREFGHRDQQGVTAAGRGAFYIHGRAA